MCDRAFTFGKYRHSLGTKVTMSPQKPNTGNSL